MNDYHAFIDGNFAVLTRLGVSFAPRAQTTADMTIRLEAGHIFDGTTLTEVAAQNTTTLVAPTTNPRIDRAVIDSATGAASVVTGTEAVSPVAPAIPVGKFPVAQILLQPSSTSITNAMITDERDLNGLGLGTAAYRDTGNTVVDPGTGALEVAVPVSSATGTNYTYTATDRGYLKNRSNSGTAMADTLPGTGSGVMPSGWFVTIVNNDNAALLSVAAGSGSTLSGSVIGYLVLGPKQQATVTSDGSNYHVVQAPERTKLAANTTLYVATTGSDANTGLTSSVPFQTIQHAMTMIANRFDLCSYLLTIQLADGTYGSGFNVQTPWTGGQPGNVIIKGNTTTPANVLISASPSVAVGYADGSNCGFRIQYLKIRATTGSCLSANFQAHITFNNIIFDTAAANHIFVYNGGYVSCAGNYSITGGAVWHVICSQGGCFFAETITVTLTGTPAFTNAFVQASVTSMIRFIGSTFTGAATGSRYYVNLNSVIFTNGGGANYFPGNAAGSTATGGQYA